jgi:hypothetical protein
VRLAKSVALNKARDVLLDTELRAEALLARKPRDRRKAPLGTWEGARWSTGYRAGGHPEARDTWSYSEPAVEPEAGQPLQAASSLIRRNPALRIVAAAVGIFAWAIVSVVRTIARGFFGQAGWPDPD